ncbi:MAG: hypothetical protein DI549_15825 [Ancylobacter novellus]|uniref:Uncharacterized protein n=1 Tax=Ancylobacter novellus TaxID=921 RepID=A0A2W5QQK3_ANCNO|nr:MAG: hypothetical protein DI549_15825 [Ancylobacter novellus]
MRQVYEGAGARALLLLGLLLALAPALARAETRPGAFVHVSDIHFNPFDRPARSGELVSADLADWPAILAAGPVRRLSRWGEDTNEALLETTLNELSRAAADADFVLVTGDMLAHEFPGRVQRALGFAPDSAESRAFAAKTTLFVIERLRAALPGKAVLLALGNTDSGCGDYRIDPGGPYLTATRATIRALVGADRLSADFDETYGAGGYYAAAHPTLPDTTVLVLDNAMWAADYRNACGSGGLDGATAMMDWLERQLQVAEAAGRKVWLMHHIPVGFDAYSTLKAKADTCRQRLVPMLAEPFGSRFSGLLARYGATVTASFSGHDHHDDYRLLRNAAGAVVRVEKVAPAISPVFGQNPGFHIFSYDRATGALADFSTRYLANLATAAGPATADWQEEYAFTSAYGARTFDPSAVEAMWSGLMANGPAAPVFRRLYNVSHGELREDEQRAYACAIGYAEPAGFAACYCDR